MQGLLGSLLLAAHPTTFRALQGWITTLPLGLDQLRLQRTMDTAAVAACFPFASADLPPPVTGGMLIGRNLRTQGLVCWDRWTQPNYNQVILARSGAGKSYLAKLEALRWLYQGVQVLVVDPENEYQRLTTAVGGAYLRLGHPGVHLNPLDLGERAGCVDPPGPVRPHPGRGAAGRPPGPGRGGGGGPGGAGRLCGPGDHQRPAHPPPPRPPPSGSRPARWRATPTRPGRCSPPRLGPYVTGSYRGLFEQPTSTHPDRHLLVVSLRDLPEELKAAGTLLALDTLWRQVTDPQHRRRRLVVVDEAWWLAQQPAGARFLARLAKSARKHWCALTVVTQDAGDLLASELGQAVVANAATHVLLGQAPQAIDRLTSAFGLTEGERQLLLAARVGEGLLAGSGGQRAAFCAQASPAEHGLVTSDPAELAAASSAAEPAW